MIQKTSKVQTKNRLMDRFQAHFYNIAYNKTKSEIGKHFNQPGHKGLEDVEIHILDFIHNHPMGRRAIGSRDFTLMYHCTLTPWTSSPTLLAREGCLQVLGSFSLQGHRLRHQGGERYYSSTTSA